MSQQEATAVADKRWVKSNRMQGSNAPANADQSGVHRPSARRHEVLLITPGGIDQRGGMGSVIRTLVDAWPTTDVPFALRVVDPWRFEWKLGFDPRSLVSFLIAIGEVFKAAVFGRLSIVHIHMAAGGSVARKSIFIWLGKLLGARVIVHSAAADLDTLWWRLPTLAQKILRTTFSRADAIVTLGSYWQRFFVHEVGVTAAHVHIIPNGVDDPGPPPKRPRVPPCRIIFVGRLGDRKGTPVLLDALAEIDHTAMDWSLTLAGDGEIDGMRARGERLGIAERCDFVGWLSGSDVHNLMRNADILVLPSRQEGLPMAILEGMAHGLAIVATDAGAIGDAITDGDNGRLVPADDAHALAMALGELISDASQRLAYQKAARERFLKDYAAATFARRFAALYQQVLTMPLSEQAHLDSRAETPAHGHDRD